MAIKVVDPLSARIEALLKEQLPTIVSGVLAQVKTELLEPKDEDVPTGTDYRSRLEIFLINGPKTFDQIEKFIIDNWPSRSPEVDARTYWSRLVKTGGGEYDSQDTYAAKQLNCRFIPYWLQYTPDGRLKYSYFKHVAYHCGALNADPLKGVEGTELYAALQQVTNYEFAPAVKAPKKWTKITRYIYD